MSKCHPCHPPVPTWPPSDCAGRGPQDPELPMVGKVLTGNGITAYGNGAYSLIGGDELSDAERDERFGEVRGSPMRPGPLRVLRDP